LVDRETIVGRIPVSDPNSPNIVVTPSSSRGVYERQGEFTASQTDTITQLMRTRTDISGSRFKESWEGNLTETDIPFSSGVFTIYQGFLEIKIDTENNTASIKNTNGPDSNEITISDQETRIDRGDQSLVLDDNGLIVNVKRFRLNSETDIEASASGLFQAKAREIHLNHG
jgi:hypothetical protein